MATDHALAVEVDRALKLNLSGGRFEALAQLIGSHKDTRKFSQELMAKSPQEVLAMIEKWRQQ